ncbi:carboxylesterase family protein [Pontibacter diazotrophicus]|uniref:Carboxylic ester hydrolase n=1 Tax=Pontibacter diazotrophicus TaxID=1400979 RepID=A0A3D8LDE2_9BACT|nr:carboxylesterase family protein [Pontibacter diazotrophicus]RDV15363.1 carboxylesterase family protein [Pontibacter diazotrophicus]
MIRPLKLLLILMLLSGQAMPEASAQTKKAKTSQGKQTATQAKTVNGIVEGTTEQSGIRAFKGVPFAAPPVGDLRWREPQPVQNWQGVREAKQFGPRGMQLAVFGDMGFRSDGMGEDCLYLNVWTPAKSEKERLPVLVYFYGGGFVAGDGSEARYDGESMAQKGIVAITVNYRLGAFGFFAHPELTKESPHNSSGNYGYMDQNAALRWVQQNIAAFGGDPSKVTIAGESAGSISVSAQMASPLSKGLIAGAIGESGALVNSSLDPIPLAEAEKNGVEFASSLGANSLAALRAMPAQQLLEAAGNQGMGYFVATIDGYFFPKSPAAIYAAGEQAKVPLLAGWNSEEMNYMMVMGQEKPTVENYENAVRRLYGEKADEVLEVYKATTDEEALQAATDLSGDRFIAYSTWKWMDLHSQSSGKPVYRYLFSRPRPPMTAEMGNASSGLAGGVVKEEDPNAFKMPAARGAVHAAEIEYAMGNLASNKVYAWTPEDYQVSEVMQNYFANFIKSGNPNGKGLPTWPTANNEDKVQVMHIDVKTVAKPEENRGRYIILDKLQTK